MLCFGCVKGDGLNPNPNLSYLAQRGIVSSCWKCSLLPISFLPPSSTSSSCSYNAQLETMVSPPPELNIIAVSFSLAVSASITNLLNSANDVDTKRSGMMYPECLHFGLRSLISFQIRCDRAKPTCQKCRQLSEDCIYDPPRFGKRYVFNIHG